MFEYKNVCLILSKIFPYFCISELLLKLPLLLFRNSTSGLNYSHLFPSTASSLSELSSLHDGGLPDFRHTYQTVQMKALPPIDDHEDQLRVAPPPQSRRTWREKINHSDDELDRG